MTLGMQIYKLLPVFVNNNTTVSFVFYQKKNIGIVQKQRECHFQEERKFKDCAFKS